METIKFTPPGLSWSTDFLGFLGLRYVFSFSEGEIIIMWLTWDLADVFFFTIRAAAKWTSWAILPSTLILALQNLYGVTLYTSDTNYCTWIILLLSPDLQKPLNNVLFWVWAHAILPLSISAIVMAGLQSAVAHWWYNSRCSYLANL